jgi:hypothetical protein
MVGKKATAWHDTASYVGIGVLLGVGGLLLLLWLLHLIVHEEVAWLHASLLPSTFQ